MRMRHRCGIGFFLCITLVSGFALGSTVRASSGFMVLQQPPAAAPADAQRMEATVAEVTGSVKKAPSGTNTADAAGWTVVKLNDLLAPGTQIKTGFRSSVSLLFGDDTVVHVKQLSNVSIDDHYTTATVKSVRLGLGYGTIRGGSTESELRSDVVVDSTVATLAKRGTEGWQLQVDPSTGRFSASVSRSGLVEALSLLTGKSRTVGPNEYANQSNIMLMWVKQDIYDRVASFYPQEGVSDTDFEAGALNTGGTSVLSPGSGTEANESGQRLQSGDFSVPNEILPQFAVTSVDRPEADFGFAPTLRDLDFFNLGLKVRPASSSAVRLKPTHQRRTRSMVIRKRR